MIDAMNELRRQGKVRHIGVSGQLPELIPAVDSGEFDVALTYNSFNLLVCEVADILLPLAEERRVGIVVGGPFYQELLSGIAGQLVEEKGGGSRRATRACISLTRCRPRSRRCWNWSGGMREL
jgi:aryl-alcohol dehydrogenase-like predicted oxidoreductase